MTRWPTSTPTSATCTNAISTEPSALPTPQNRIDGQLPDGDLQSLVGALPSGSGGSAAPYGRRSANPPAGSEEHGVIAGSCLLEPGRDQAAAFLHSAGTLHPLPERAEEIPPQRRHRQQDQRPAAVERMGGF